MANMIELRGITKKYFIGRPNELTALCDIDLDVREGEFISIIGESGSGKSTMMNILGVLDRPTSGQYTLGGVDISAEDDDALSELRKHKVGFIFQTFNLLPRTTAVKNVETPMLYAHKPLRERQERSRQLLEMVDMLDRAKHQPNELSGGQKQRVAIARAMANNPDILLADEPTGALDSATGRMVMDIFHQLNREQGKTVILITHCQELAEETERIITLRDGHIIGERPGSCHPESVKP